LDHRRSTLLVVSVTRPNHAETPSFVLDMMSYPASLLTESVIPFIARIDPPEQLQTDMDAAFRLGAAIHAYHATAPPHASSDPLPTCDKCDQYDWAKRWSRIIRDYNYLKDEYKPSTASLNKVVVDGLKQYSAK